MIYTVTLNPALDRELVVARIETDTVLRAEQVHLDFGGKGFNISRSLAAWGVANTAVGFVGGYTGQWMQSGLQAMGIATQFVPISGETRTNVSIVNLADGGYIKVNEPGPLIHAEEVAALLRLVESTVKPGDWWLLSGSLPPGVPVDIYRQLVRLVKAAGGKTVLDTSGDALRQGILAGPDLIKPNLTEAAELSGKKITGLAQTVQAAQEIRSGGIAQVVISMGSQGAVLAAASETWQAVAPEIVEQNPIGAGDAMVAGMIYGYLQNWSPARSLRWGVACGSAAASLPGTAISSFADIAALDQRVELFQLA